MALETMEVRREVAIDAARLWDVISGVGGVDRWFTGVILTCRVEGSGVGAKRFCTMAGGVKLNEQIVEIDHGRMSFGYTIEDNSALPAQKILGTMQLRPLGQGRTEFVWKAEYEPREGMPVAMRTMLEEVYPTGIQSLVSYCQAG